ncbi:hypothetical protein PGTUg99_033606 [Puccinia graminis f. sp. tritici]|uniref:Uncharacterized protein n=1 Tax=Puccinia graminis f. sp. tritici TaxID=56615 RepID=A0A5B0R909_PUCGR|nr:hypothetical protein PGTUg99_033606 [Puccinia graminis f. sp. tritici]
MTVKLTDLPAEVVNRIIARCMDHRRLEPESHHGLDHDGLGPIPQRPRPHREDNPPYLYPRTISEMMRSPQLPYQVSWPEGLPSNPLVVLSLVSRTFRQCAQKELFSNVCLSDRCQAYLFIRVLTCPSTAQREPATPGAPLNSQPKHIAPLEIVQSSEINHRVVNKLAQHVRSIQFNPRSMGLGGGSLICDVLHCCPLLENIAISMKIFESCREPILKALERQPLIKEFVTLESYGQVHTTVLQWKADEVVNRLFPKWKSLETIEFNDLSFSRPVATIDSIPEPIPVLNCALRTILLKSPELDERELSWLLKTYSQSIRTLKIIHPSKKLDRTGLCRILQECTGPNLESLTLKVDTSWHPIKPSSKMIQKKHLDNPAKNQGLLDIVFRSSSALRNLKSLSLAGDLVGADCLSLLPESLVKLALDDFQMLALAFTQLILSRLTGKDDGESAPEPHHSQPDSHSDQPVQWLPNLQCCSIADWPRKEWKIVSKALEARGVCCHSDYNSDCSSESDQGESEDSSDESQEQENSSNEQEGSSDEEGDS